MHTAEILCQLILSRHSVIFLDLILIRELMQKEAFIQNGKNKGYLIRVINIQTMDKQKKLTPALIFIFGGSGDLNYRKLTPALYNLFMDGLMPEKFNIVGIARSEYAGD